MTDVVTQAELDSIQSLDARSRGIVDLTGIGRLSNLVSLNVSDNKIKNFSMIDFGKIIEVIGDGQLKDVTIDVDWSEEVMIAPGKLLMEAIPVLSKPISSYADFYSVLSIIGDPIDDLGITWEDIVEYPNSGMEWDKSKIGLKSLKNVDQTIGMYSYMQSSLPGNGLDMRIGAEFKVRINQVSKKVTFDNEGIESSNQIPVTDLIKEPTTPTKQGYAFLGWYDARSGGTKWDFVTDKMLKVLIFLIYLQKYWDFFKLFSITI
ncbi:InlB B-repeat-containing protein [Listeria monocytogenes]|nr:InlB B-repeat-containing protein [Listeria monocytogenes]